MVEKANKIAINDRGKTDHPIELLKAWEVNAIPWIPAPAIPGSYTVVRITSAVRVQITTVSIKGSIKPT